MSLASLQMEAVVVFKAVGTPGTIKLVTTVLCSAKTIIVALGTLNASNQVCQVQEILVQIHLLWR